MSFSNIYTHRKVAEGSAKGCEICFKPTTSVLITADNKDFFYLCPSHMNDRAFCTPVAHKTAGEEGKRSQVEKHEKELKEEVERIKKEYEEKRKKEESKKQGNEDKVKKETENDKDQDEQERIKAKGDQTQNDEDSNDNKSSNEDEPRVFVLHKFVYQQRIERRRRAETAKRNRERLVNPSYFPSVPKGLP